MKRRNFLIGAGSAAIGGSALVGTSAFSRVDAHRSVTVSVAEDPEAYLGMNDCMDADGNVTPNSSFAEIGDDGHLEVEMGPSGNGGQGVNSSSISWFDNVFQLCNQGKEDVCLWISEKTGDDPERVTFYVDADQRDGSETPERLTDDDPDTRELVENDEGLRTLSSAADSIALELGECVCVGIQVYTKEDDSFEITAPSEGAQLLEEVGLVADVNETACRDLECADLSAEYLCTDYELSDSSNTYEAQGTDITIQNNGTAATDWGYAIRDSPNEYEAISETDRTIGPGETVTEPLNAADPKEGFLYWEDDDACPADKWGERKGDFDSDFVTTVENDELTDINDDSYVATLSFNDDVASLDELGDPNNDIPPEDFPERLEDTDIVACRTV